MAKEFSNDRLFSNIAYLIKLRKIKVGEVEKAAGVSTGYISRMKKEPNVKPGIDFIVKAAYKLGVSVDTLIGIELGKLTYTELYLLTFMQKLKADTDAERLDWIRESVDALTNVECDINGNPYHPFLSYETFYVDAEEGYPTKESGPVFVSRAFDNQTAIHGDCYSLRIKNNTTLFLADISKVCYRLDDPDAFAKEVWLYQPEAGKQFLCSDQNSHFKVIIHSLFTSIDEYMKHPHIKSGFRTAIDAFMKNDLKDDPAPTPTLSGKFDDEPPF